MEIIRDEDYGGIFMIPLLAQWRIKRCNAKDCKEHPNTIVVGIHPDAPTAVGLCEEHYQLCNKPGGGNLSLEVIEIIKPKEGKSE